MESVLAKIKPGFRTKVYDIPLGYEDLCTLKPQRLLNDEVMNAYMKKVVVDEDRVSRDNENYLFNTFFFINLKKWGYEKVCGWTRHVNIFLYPRVIIPIHVPEESHWCLIVIHMKRHVIEYYDSDGDAQGGAEYFPLVRDYLAAEYKRVSGGGVLNQREWSTTNLFHSLPQQENDYDCGVFVCQYVRALVEGRSTRDISPKDMSFYREEMLEKLINHGVK